MIKVQQFILFPAWLVNTSKAINFISIPIHALQVNASMEFLILIPFPFIHFLSLIQFLFPLKFSKHVINFHLAFEI